MLSICIVDDEKECVDTVSEYLKLFFAAREEKYSVTVFNNGEDLIKNYKFDLDIIFLDIEMPKMDGMTAAKEIRRKDSGVVIIFLTRMAKYAVKGYEVNALDFIVKPVDYNSFKYKLSRGISALPHRRMQKIELHVGADCVWIDSSEIYYIDVIKHDLTFHTSSGNYTIRGSLNEFYEKLRCVGFRACSRYCLVNMKFVNGIYSWYILVNNQKIEVSRRKRKELMDDLLDYYGGENV